MHSMQDQARGMYHSMCSKAWHKAVVPLIQRAQYVCSNSLQQQFVSAFVSAEAAGCSRLQRTAHAVAAWLECIHAQTRLKELVQEYTSANMF